jgi:CheY-like chemotaxis protein
MTCVEATSLHQGAALAGEQRPFDVILANESAANDADSLIPVLQQLSCPFIVMTPLGNSKTLAEAAVPHVVKPVKPSRLYNAFINLFDSTTLPLPAVKPTAPLGAAVAPLRLLIADDNLINQKVAQRILERLGYPADTVTNGGEGLAQLQQQAYDVILMDVQMPEMDGITATQQIHERYLPGERPYIIALTANALTGDKEQYLACGMDDYLSKPIRIEDMQEALNRFLERLPNPVA